MVFYTTEDQIADIFVKELSIDPFERNKTRLGIMRPSAC